jgi:hypothetical protein
MLCWGGNSFGQLGNAKTTDSSTPVVVTASSWNADRPGIPVHLSVPAGTGATCPGHRPGRPKPNLRPHVSRPTCASLLLAQGVPARVVVEVLGRSRIADDGHVHARDAGALEWAVASAWTSCGP